MVVLNLVDLDKSDIKYQIQKFPDGQQNVVINYTLIPFSSSPIPLKNYDILYGKVKEVQIKSRLNNWFDVELIVCAAASLRLCGVKEIHLYVPYILGARSDRKFEIGGNRYIKDVIAPVLNSLNLESVTCIDPHSYVLENCINNFQNKTNSEVVQWSLVELKKQNYTFNKDRAIDYLNDIVLISPDAGASHKIYKLAEQIGYKGDIVTCSKERDKDGKIVKTIVPIKDTGPLCKKDYIIIDDICDGGATFINIAKEIKKAYSCNHIYLIVTHSIFSKGTDELLKYFDGIYTTNSYKESNVEKVKVLNVF